MLRLSCVALERPSASETPVGARSPCGNQPDASPAVRHLGRKEAGLHRAAVLNKTCRRQGHGTTENGVEKGVHRSPPDAQADGWSSGGRDHARVQRFSRAEPLAGACTPEHGSSPTRAMTASAKRLLSPSRDWLLDCGFMRSLIWWSCDEDEAADSGLQNRLNSLIL